MMTWPQLLFGGAGGLGVGLATVLGLGWLRWRWQIRKLSAGLAPATAVAGEARVDFSALDSLPAPVARYLRLVLTDGQPLIRTARLRETGCFHLRQADKTGCHFRAKQYVGVQPPGFIWDARICMLPGLTIWVRDGYLAGKGWMLGRLAGLLPMINASDRVELHAGALQRYLAEAVWFPTALLPEAGVTWSAIDEHSALASLHDGDTDVCLTFHFNEQGEACSVSTPGRYRELNGKYVLTPWIGHFRNYHQYAGMRIPAEGEVAWQLPEGDFVYWQGRIQAADYAFAS